MTTQTHKEQLQRKNRLETVSKKTTRQIDSTHSSSSFIAATWSGLKPLPLQIFRLMFGAPHRKATPELFPDEIASWIGVSPSTS